MRIINFGAFTWNANETASKDSQWCHQPWLTMIYLSCFSDLSPLCVKLKFLFLCELLVQVLFLFTFCEPEIWNKFVYVFGYWSFYGFWNFHYGCFLTSLVRIIFLLYVFIPRIISVFTLLSVDVPEQISTTGNGHHATTMTDISVCIFSNIYYDLRSKGLLFHVPLSNAL